MPEPPDPPEPFPPVLYVPEDCQYVEEEGVLEGYPDLEQFVDGETVAVYKFDRVVEIRVNRTMETPEDGADGAD